MSILSGRTFSVEYSVNANEQSPTWTAVPQVESITPPEISYDTETVDLLDSSEKYGVKVVLGSTVGDLSVTVSYDPSVHNSLDALVGEEMSETTHHVRIKKGTSVIQEFTWVGLSRRVQEISKRAVLRCEYIFHVGRPVAQT